jgi:hypothetical protein
MRSTRHDCTKRQGERRRHPAQFHGSLSIVAPQANGVSSLAAIFAANIFIIQ